ncbi:MAG: type II toxin-antitoxin system Phd/YefM family antitoxin [Pseudomonadota bacterium]|nr:type II toxin-antitoxin system Phd/YefM family antitoxin [Pseudomonadota bacterium]
MNWQLQEAKNKLSKVVEEARKSGPQVITVRGKDAAVVLSIEDYRRLALKEDSLADFLLTSPLHGSGIEIERERDFERKVKL